MKRIDLLLLLLISFNYSFSQYNTYGGAGGVNFGYAMLDTKPLNEILPSDLQLNNHFITLGGDGYGVYKRYVIGGSGYAIYGPGANNDSTIVSFNGGAGFVNFGYVAYNLPRFKFIPMLGVGGVGMSLRMSRFKDITLQDLQNESFNETELNWGNFIFEIGFNIEYFLNKDPEETTKGLRLGLKAGYTFSPASNKWKYAGGSVTGLPKFMMNGFFVRLTIGGGFFANEKIEKK